MKKSKTKSLPAKSPQVTWVYGHEKNDTSAPWCPQGGGALPPDVREREGHVAERTGCFAKVRADFPPALLRYD